MPRSTTTARGKTGYERDAFTIDFADKRAVCPQNEVSSTWNETRYNDENAVPARRKQHVDDLAVLVDRPVHVAPHAVDLE